MVTWFSMILVSVQVLYGHMVSMILVSVQVLYGHMVLYDPCKCTSPLWFSHKCTCSLSSSCVKVLYDLVDVHFCYGPHKCTCSLWSL